MNLPSNPFVVAQPRMLIVVRDTDLNRTNDFWKLHIGKSGVIAQVHPDGLVDAVLVDTTCVFGISPARFDLGEIVAEPPPARRPWWSRLLLWRLMFWRRS